MAKAKKKKKRFAIRFELGFGGLLAATVVCFCIFLWMFLLGIWAGQTVLQNSGGAGLKLPTAAGLAAKGGIGGGKEEEEVLSSPSKWPPDMGEDALARDAEPEYGGQTFFTLQVGAYETEQQVLGAVAAWRARDQEAFYGRPAGKENRFRVFVGKFDTLERANDRAAAFERQHDGKVYITLVQESEVVEP